MLITGNLAPVVRITNQSVNDDLGVNNPASAGYRLTAAGAVDVIPAGSASTVENWLTPAFLPANYEVRVTASGSGGTFTGTTGSWLSLGSDRTWTLSSTTSGVQFARTLTVEIRDAATLAVLSTATVTLTVEAL